MNLEQVKINLTERISRLEKRIESLPLDAKRSLALQLKADLNFAKKRLEAARKKATEGTQE